MQGKELAGGRKRAEFHAGAKAVTGTIFGRGWWRGAGHQTSSLAGGLLRWPVGKTDPGVATVNPSLVSPGGSKC